VHGGLLAIRGNAGHEAAAAAQGIAPIDLLAVNLYPFEATVAKGAAFEDCIENIDIGGPAMIRAAAKNHAAVTVVVDPADYGRVLDAMSGNGGTTTLALRKALAAKAYARTAAYDAAISAWFAATLGRRRRPGAPSAVGSPRSCAMARTRTSRRRSISGERGGGRAPSAPGQGLSYNKPQATPTPPWS
jgi:AICAR transformylase/IMP cyclohydrolase PurH